MKGRQIALTLYLPPQKYRVLKSVSKRKGRSMQDLLRGAVDQVLVEGSVWRGPGSSRTERSR